MSYTVHAHGRSVMYMDDEMEWALHVPLPFRDYPMQRWQIRLGLGDEEAWLSMALDTEERWARCMAALHALVAPTELMLLLQRLLADPSPEQAALAEAEGQQIPS